MDDIKKWALCVTLCAFAGAVVYILAPKGVLEKPMRTVVSLFIIAAIFSPFLNGEGIDLNLLSTIDSIDTQQKTDIEELIDEQVEKSVADVAKAEIEAVLKENNIKDGQISIITDISDDGSIIIKEAGVTVGSKYKSIQNDLSKDLKERLGLDIEVSIKGAGD